MEAITVNTEIQSEAGVDPTSWISLQKFPSIPKNVWKSLNHYTSQARGASACVLRKSKLLNSVILSPCDHETKTTVYEWYFVTSHLRSLSRVDENSWVTKKLWKPIWLICFWRTSPISPPPNLPFVLWITVWNMFRECMSSCSLGSLPLFLCFFLPFSTSHYWFSSHYFFLL